MKMDFTLVLMAVLLPGFQEAVAFEVKAEEGEEIKIKCVHSNADSNIKYFCREPCADKDVLLTSTKKDENGKYKIENKGNTFFVTVSRATLADSGTYWCGIDRVGVDTYTRVDIVVTKRSSDHEGSEALSGITPTTKKLLYIGTGLGVVGLALAVVLLAFFRHRKQSSSDYEPMMPRVIAEPQHRCQCSDPNCTELSTLPPSLGDSPSLASKQRESDISLAFRDSPSLASKQRESHISLSDYAEMDSPTLSFTRQYEHLDPNSLENHVYHSLQANGEPKRGPSKETAGKRHDSV